MLICVDMFFGLNQTQTFTLHNGKGIHRSPDAIVTKFNKLKLMGFNNDNTGEESTDE